MFNMCVYLHSDFAIGAPRYDVIGAVSILSNYCTFENLLCISGPVHDYGDYNTCMMHTRVARQLVLRSDIKEILKYYVAFLELS